MKKLILLFILFVSVTHAQTNITKIEYWIDNDPGFDNAITFNGFAQQPNVISQFQIPSNLSLGIHTIGVRSKDTFGNWSHTNFASVYVTENTINNLSKIEYFWDTDPGFDNAITYNSFSSQPNAQFQFQPQNPNNLSEGIHNIGVRSKDANGLWSHTNFIPVYITDSSNGQISRIEYFWDVDPGFGLATDTILSLPLANINNGILNANLSGIGAGNHVLYVRTIDSRGRSSHTNYVDSVQVNITSINEISVESGINIYPNPFVNEITIVPSKNEEARLILYDVAGRKVIDRMITEQLTLDTQQLTSGMYTVFLWTEKNRIYKSTIVKQQ